MFPFSNRFLEIGGPFRFQLSKHLRHLLFLDLVAPTILHCALHPWTRTTILFIHLGDGQLRATDGQPSNKKWTSTSQLEVFRGKSRRNVGFHRKINEKFWGKTGKTVFTSFDRIPVLWNPGSLVTVLKTNITFRMKWGIKNGGMIWNGNWMEWNGMIWNGMIWNDMKWNGMEMEWRIKRLHCHDISPFVCSTGFRSQNPSVTSSR